jgi:sialic acid synthase SpsE
LISKNPLKKTPFFVAEISANHNGSLSHAKKLIKIAKRYGADAVKLQTYTPDTLTIKSNKPDFKIRGGLWNGKTLWDLYEKAQTPFEWHKELFDWAKKLKIIGLKNAIINKDEACKPYVFEKMSIEKPKRNANDNKLRIPMSKGSSIMNSG